MMIADGYDTGIISVATPAILRDWKIQPKDMGLVFSMSAIGLLIGSLFYGWLDGRPLRAPLYHHFSERSISAFRCC